MKRKNRDSRQGNRCEYHQLEPRKMLAGISFNSQTGVISIDGSEAPDAVRIVNDSASQLSVVFDGVETRAFAKHLVTRIVFTARGGDDWFRNETSIDSTVYGQMGADRLLGGSGRDRLRGGLGDDQLLGGDNDDYINGDEGHDFLDGGNGNDLIEGFSGADQILGGAGNDWITAGFGNDFVNAGNGDDTVFGFDGDDRILGGYGADLIAGQNGNDEILGEGGEDVLYGNDGEDKIWGGNVSDRIYGGDGDDKLYGDDGADFIYAQAGNDFVIAGNQSDAVYGDLGNDTIYGGDHDDILNGGAGADRLFGQAGLDRLFGLDGNDILYGGLNRDTLVGGTGNDDLYSDSEDSVVYDDEDDDSENDDVYLRSGALSNRLTLSFAPDGTSIFGQANQLFSAFSAILTPAQIEETLIRSFGIWAVNGNLDVGLVSDSGDPFGTSGQAIGDPRFGDVRIGAVPLASDVYAVAMGQGEVVSGTWAGDILFNSNATFESPEHFFAVALHEVGHALGLKHVVNIDSAMHRYSNRTDLSPQDVSNFQALYGLRQLDQNDVHGSHQNDDIDHATDIKPDDHGNEPGVYPSILYGDIHNTTDLDYFVLEVPDDYTGPVSFRAVSSGISLLAPAISVYSGNGTLIHRSESTATGGDIVSFTVTGNHQDQKIFVRVDGGAGQSLGGYSLITSLDDRNVVTEPSMLSVARDQKFSRLDERDIAEYFADPENYLLGDDHHSDDDFLSASELDDEDGYSAFSRFHRRASLSDNTDVDIYKFETVQFEGTSHPLLNISVRSVEIGGMIPKVTVYDSQQNPVVSQVVVNGRGEYVLQVAGIESEKEYFVFVGADNLLPFQSGSYELTVSYSFEPVQFLNRAGGTVSVSQKQYHSLHVAESQIMQFGLETSAVNNPGAALLWATIYNQAGDIVYQSATRAGERRTSSAVYLAPGSYTIEIETVHTELDGLAYKLVSVTVGDGQGPTFSDPTDSPFPKNQNGDYVYPDDVITDSTFVFVNGQASNLPPPPPDNPPTNIFNWYWGV